MVRETQALSRILRTSVPLTIGTSLDPASCLDCTHHIPITARIRRAEHPATRCHHTCSTKADLIMRRIRKDIEARSVITIIESLSRKLDVPLMGFFERSSEFAHPNYQGMMATYTDEGAEGGFKILRSKDGNRAAAHPDGAGYPRHELQHHRRHVRTLRHANGRIGNSRGARNLRRRHVAGRRALSGQPRSN